MCQIANDANEHCSKTEQQKSARLDQMQRIEPEEALNQQNKDGQGLIKEMKGIGVIDPMRRGMQLPKYNAIFKVFAKVSCIAFCATST